MDELFRFSVARPADRTRAATLPLERNTPFQAQLERIANDESAEKWSRFASAASEFLTGELPRLAAFDDDEGTALDSVLARALRGFAADLEKALDASTPPKWPDAASALMAPLRPRLQAFQALEFELADLFLALLLFRAGGPSRIRQLVRAKQPDLAELFRADRPSLRDIALLLRAVELVLRLAADPAPFSSADALRAALAATLLLPPKVFAVLEKPAHAAGIADLLVVKQHVHHYELGEIARIENVLAGETRSHTQKHSLSTERETVFETETQTQTEQELTTTDHVSIRNEAENILKEDTKIDAGVHAQYDGGSYKIQADFSAAYDRSSSDAKKFASETAKDITQKASKRVSERVLQSTRTKIVETFEEDEEQKFENPNGPNVSGVYQWVNKVYLAQVFNYGKRLLFDITVPEPAASLLAAAASPAPRPKRSVPPDPLGTVLVDAQGKPILDVDGNKQLDKPLRPEQLVPAPTTDPARSFYGDWIAAFHVTGVEPPPAETITAAKSFSENSRDNNVHLQGVVNIDDGYAAITYSASVAWRTTSGKENESRTDVIVGEKLLSWGKGLNGPNLNPAQDSRDYTGFAQDVPLRLDDKDQPLSVEQRSIGIAVESTFSEEAALNIEVRCVRTPELLARWQLQTYDKIAAQWKALWDDYQSNLAKLASGGEPAGQVGAADSEINRQTERTELKRSCLAILADDRSLVDGQNAVVALSPFGFDPDLAVTEETGALVRFFEEAFEWERISYVFYPYFWGRASQWVDRLRLRNDDPLFENFLRAGYARVVIPVRKDFEDAVNFFLLTGQPWMGGGLPSVSDKLYLPITEEIKEQTGAPGDEVPVGDPWFVYLPTGLLKLRTGKEGQELPKWKRLPVDVTPPPGPWSWGLEDPKP